MVSGNAHEERTFEVTESAWERALERWRLNDLEEHLDVEIFVKKDFRSEKEEGKLSRLEEKVGIFNLGYFEMMVKKVETALKDRLGSHLQSVQEARRSIWRSNTCNDETKGHYRRVKKEFHVGNWTHIVSWYLRADDLLTFHKRASRHVRESSPLSLRYPPLPPPEPAIFTTRAERIRQRLRGS